MTPMRNISSFIRIQEAFVLIFLLSLYLTACGAVSDKLCDVESISSQLSPGENSKVVVRVRNCGATTDYVTEVSIIPASRDNITGYGNAFRAKGYLDETSLEIRWQKDNELLIVYPADITVYMQKYKVREVKVNYQAKSAP